MRFHLFYLLLPFMPYICLDSPISKQINEFLVEERFLIFDENDMRVKNLYYIYSTHFRCMHVGYISLTAALSRGKHPLLYNIFLRSPIFLHPSSMRRSI